ncbi:MAG: VWA domain-containing protein [Candidatus Obscuribacterales bacterium]|nr:VWA domain-containing protein [Candidatus Obscuribacterales bacterium]
MWQYIANTTSDVASHWVALAQLLFLNYRSVHFADVANWTIIAFCLPLMIGCSFFAMWRYMRLRRSYGKPSLVNTYSSVVTVKSEWWRLCLRLLIPCAIVFALLNPYAPGMPHRVPSGNRDFAVCIADNKGMGAMEETSAPVAIDGNPNKDSTSEGGQFFHESGSRMDLVRTVLRGLLTKSLAKTNVALIAFQGQANVVVPLTDSPEWLNDTLDPANKYGLRVGQSSLVGQGQVDGKVATIAACFSAARQVFKEEGVKGHEKFILYFGNGDDISSEDWMRDEVQKLHEDNVLGAIFGVGGAPVSIPVYDGDDEQFSGYYKFKDGEEAKSGYNEANLVKLAEQTGWRYEHLDPKHLPGDDAFASILTDSKIEIGRWLLFDYPVELALSLIVLLALGDLGATLLRIVSKPLRSYRSRR